MLNPSSPADPLLAAVLRGLASPQKTLPPTLFYDAVGSALFDRITTLPAYYPTRVEASILADHGRSIARAAADGAQQVVVIEPGCGSGAKAAALLAHLPAVAYVGIDVSVSALVAGTGRLEQAFPGVRVIGVEADYHAPFDLPSLPEGRRVVFFPGSTIGNFDPPEAVSFLRVLGRLAGRGGFVVVGVDLWKDADVLRVAYDDPEGVTAAFNLNALSHLNHRYQADFDSNRFRHEARVNAERRRVEMHLVAERAHSFSVGGLDFHIAAGESLHTECAYKYEVAGFQALAAEAGLVAVGVWTDASDRFAVCGFATSG